jgi:UDPglucose 6-dehydrogenase
LLSEVERLNEEAVEAVAAKLREALWNLEGKRIAILGLAFKPDTDDVRFSPALSLARLLLASGAQVVGCDPRAAGGAKDELPELELANDVYEAATGAHALVIGTEWPEFRGLELSHLREVMTYPLIVDGRNLLDPADLVGSGFWYYPTGRPPVIPVTSRPEGGSDDGGRRAPAPRQPTPLR